MFFVYRVHAFLYLYLHHAIPTRGNNDGVRVVGRETHAADPVCVSIILYGIFALGQCIPQLNSLVPRAGDDLTVVHGESDAQDILLTETNLTFD